MLAIKRFFLLGVLALQTGDFRTAFLQFPLGFVLVAEDFFLRFNQSFFFLCLTELFSFFDDRLCFCFCGADCSLADALASDPAAEHADGKTNDSNQGVKYIMHLYFLLV